MDVGTKMTSIDVLWETQNLLGPVIFLDAGNLYVFQLLLIGL